jgi:hypothetical protein
MSTQPVATAKRCRTVIASLRGHFDLHVMARAEANDRSITSSETQLLCYSISNTAVLANSISNTVVLQFFLLTTKVDQESL